jgi:streptogramin lyase
MPAISRITPAGVITEFPLPANNFPTGGLTVGPDGDLWFPEDSYGSAGSAIGRITPAGALTEFPLPAGDGPGDLTVGPDGDLWFPEHSYSSAGPGAVGRITPAGTITQVRLPTADIDPDRLTVGPDGNLWFLEYTPPVYTAVRPGYPLYNAIGRITPAGMITQVPLPTAGISAGAPTVGPDGNLWFFFSDGSQSEIGRITPAGALTTFRPPAGFFFRTNLTVGPDGNLWFTGGSGIDRLDPTPPRVTKVGAVAHPGRAITSIHLGFDEALDPASASKGRFYGIAAAVANGQTVVFSKAVKIARVSYDRAAHAVRLKLAVPQKGPVQVTVHAGLVAADGMSSFGDFTAVVR